MLHQIRPFRAAFVAALCSLAGSVAFAQTAVNYPSKPVKVIVPYAVGGGTDLTARLFADALSRETGQSFVVDNRGGADTIIGTVAAAKAPGDGYTLLLTTDALLVNHWTRKDPGYKTFDDLTVISMLATGTSILAVTPSLPVKTLTEFVSYARANPAKINVGSASLVAVLKYRHMMAVTNSELTIVNYKGAAPAVIDLLAGTIEALFISAPNVQQDIQAGKLRGLALTGASRVEDLPDVPTFQEAGLPQFQPTSNMNALFAPSRTPKEIIDKLNATVRKVQTSPEFVKQLGKQGLRPDITSTAEAAKVMQTESEKFGKLLQEAGVKPE